MLDHLDTNCTLACIWVFELKAGGGTDGNLLVCLLSIQDANFQWHIPNTCHVQ